MDPYLIGWPREMADKGGQASKGVIASIPGETAGGHIVRFGLTGPLAQGGRANATNQYASVPASQVTSSCVHGSRSQDANTESPG